ncbi:MAG: RdgB/HAM1 family non-canonical purine NTP pyrophosphatase [Acidimicrobiia bacterium]|nr:RdgB/HAM1 family non-canonical purine NTP pyrophosphatase [Acidimicrobiia bacterium]MDH5236949.1 RdgB/HAM1 family non-canonical purine NTP pyrophosphatase [Acidimicrobiia bacterium]
MTAPSDLEFVVASANPDKVAEIQQVFGDRFVLLPRPVELPDVVEDGETLEANARLKAVAVAIATGRPAVADDTGLEVDALAGAPGVHSARFAGEAAIAADNMTKLLDALHGRPDADRAARFHTVALARWPTGDEVVAHGVCEGRITTERRGEGGFGYDPIFEPREGGGRTFAEMGQAKHAISHRARAFRALAAALA